MIRRVGPDDWADWRLLRQRSLTVDRESFAASARLWTGADDTEERWRELLATDACFIAYDGGSPVGMVAGRVAGDAATLNSMWVAPEARQRGAGRQLIDAVIAWSAGRELSLRVIDGNAAAIGAYEAAGFVLQDGVDVERCRRMVWTPPPYRLVAAGVAASGRGRFARVVGLRGVLRDTNRVARSVPAPSEAAVDSMVWDARDQRTTRWWPQGITTSADASPGGSGTFEGRSVVITSWYARGWVGRLLGSRLSVIDGVDGPSHGYRHVLLMERVRLGRFLPWFRPVRVHAGGIVWFGDHLYVAGSSRGVRVFRLDDILRVRNRLWSRGYRYVLPQLTTYVAQRDADAAPLTYSFLSLDHAGEVPHLVAGEYGRKGGSHRLVRFVLDPETGLLRSDERGWAVPAALYDRQVARMQGATVVDGTWIISASSGEGIPGDLWVGRPGGYTRHRGVLPTGPEDLTYWPQRGQVWTLTEWPGRRWVFGIDVARWTAPPPR